jgi:acyl-CoA reductase-like NAD-dependent aldehyde dehydrogenase
VLKSRTLQHPAYSDAVVRTPTIVKLASADEASYPSEVFGPVSFAIATADTDESIDIFRRTVGAHGAITAGVYSTDESVLDRVHDAACEVGVAVSFNLTGPVYVNQTVAFSDFHATGANPAATACYAVAAFVAERFRFIEARREYGGDRAERAARGCRRASPSAAQPAASAERPARRGRRLAA